MVDTLPFMLIFGTILGFLAGIGVGGGSLLILWLTVVLDTPPDVARGINLLFFLPSACISCFFRWKQGVLDFKILFPAILAGCAAAALFSWLGTKLDIDLIKKLFGGLLIMTGLRELLYKARH